jgi:hypothetical protein
MREKCAPTKKNRIDNARLANLGIHAHGLP